MEIKRENIFIVKKISLSPVTVMIRFLESLVSMYFHQIFFLQIPFITNNIDKFYKTDVFFCIDIDDRLDKYKNFNLINNIENLN